jgi:hypothetical protein
MAFNKEEIAPLVSSNSSYFEPDGFIAHIHINKGNNNITELRTIFQREVKTQKYINRKNQLTTGKL